MDPLNANMKKTLSFILFLPLSLSACAPQPKFSQNIFTLNNAQPQAFSFYNQSTQNILIDIAYHNGSAQAGYASELHPKNYSIFVHGGSKAITLACYRWPWPTMQRLNCGQILEVKALTALSITENTGNYWVKEDITKAQFNNVIASKK